MKVIDNTNATNAKATRGNVYIIHTTQIHTNKYIEHISNKPTTTSRRDRKVCDCTTNNVVATDFSRSRE